MKFLLTWNRKFLSQLSDHMERPMIGHYNFNFLISSIIKSARNLRYCRTSVGVRVRLAEFRSDDEFLDSSKS